MADISPAGIALLGLTLLLGSFFGLLVGFRDAPNAVALPVRFRALSPRPALAVAAVMNFCGVLVGAAFAEFLADRLLSSTLGTHAVLIGLSAALTASCLWGVFCWLRRVPVSSTHGFLSGLMGAALALHLLTPEVFDLETHGLTLATILAGIVLSPLIAWLLSILAVRPVVAWQSGGEPSAIDHRARVVLAVAAGANALGHGAQTGHRVVLLWLTALAAVGVDGESLRLGAGLTAAVLVAVGTLGGAWRIAHTLTERLVPLDPLRAAVASCVSAVLLFVGSMTLHLPLSTSHTTTASIVGAGMSRPFTAVRWNQVVRIVLYWVATPVACGLVGLAVAAALSPLS